MKNQLTKIIIIFSLFLFTIFPNYIQAQEYKWGEWTPLPCFNGLESRTRKVPNSEYKGKEEWRTQFRNRYKKSIVFSWRADSTDRKLDDESKRLGPQNRQELKPGEQDSGAMWILVTPTDKLWMAIGHVRFLEQNEQELWTTYERCDEYKARGKIDYFCQVKPSPGCPNFVNPKPAALVNFDKPANRTGGTQSSAASTEDCLEAYEYFSKYRKSDNPIAVKQAIEAAQAFQTRCKLTEEQNAVVGQAITNSQNYLQRIQSNLLQNKSSATDLLNGTEAVKKFDVDGLKLKMVSILRLNLKPYRIDTPRERTTIRNRSNYNEYEDYKSSFTELKDLIIKEDNNSITVSYTSVYNSLYDRCKECEFRSTTKDQMTIFYDKIQNEVKNAKYISCYNGFGATCLSETTQTDRYGTTNSQSDRVNINPSWLGENNFNEFKSLSIQLAQINSDKSITNSTDNRDTDLPKIEPTTVEQHQKKVVAEAKAKGINLSPDGLDAPKKTTSARLTPRQRVAQDAVNRKKINKLIAEAETEAPEKTTAEKRVEPEKSKPEIQQRSAADLIEEELNRVSATDNSANRMLPAPVLVSPNDGATFDVLPRETHLIWNPVQGASGYVVEVTAYIRTLDANGYLVKADYVTQFVTEKQISTEYVFQFVGAQPGKWRVWAIDAKGNPGTKSEWRSFLYTK